MKFFSRRPSVRCSHALLGLTTLLVIAHTGVDAERLPLRSYSTADGLAHTTITRIVRDSQGFLWFCTPNGLSRFDGYAFRTFGIADGLPAAPVNDLLETDAGDYWAATDNGLVDLTGWKPSTARATRTAESRAVRIVIPAAGNLRSRTITVLRQTRDGTIWAGTRAGLFRLSHEHPAASLELVDITLHDQIAEQRIITDLMEDRRGTLWIATPAGLYRRWSDGTTAHYTSDDGLTGNDISDLLEDRQGAIWVATRTNGLFRLRVDATQARPLVTLTVDMVDGLPDPWVTRVFEASDGRLWAATARGVVEVLSGAYRPTVRRYRREQGFVESYTGAIEEDLSGNLWIGSSLEGALKFMPNGFTSYGAADDIQSVNDVFEDERGAVCVRGIVVAPDPSLDRLRASEWPKRDAFGCLTGARFEWFEPRAVKLWGWVREGITLKARNGEWWIGSEQGVLRYAPTSGFMALATAKPVATYDTSNGLAAIQIFRMFQDSRGDVWISSISSATRGLSRFERQSGRLYDIGRLPGLPSPTYDIVRSFAEDPSGSVWLGFNSGLARYTRGVVSFFTTAEGLPAGPIRDMQVDHRGRLWLASERAGLIRVDNPSSAVPTFVSYTTTDGLSSNSLIVIVEDRNGFLYVGGGNGIDRLDPANGRVRHFTEADGLNGGILNEAFADRNGVLWFGTSNGLARLEPAPPPRTAAPPPILISNLRVAGLPYLVSPFGEREINLADLPSKDHQLEIEFLGLGFGLGEVLSYQYRLDEKGEWSQPSHRRGVTYANLGPGRYTFAVRAVNSDGTSSAHPAHVTFRILPPLWQRWWFVAGVALVIAIALDAVFRSRVRRLVQIANMRTRIATDLHDDIGANLTRIALLSEVAQRTHEGAPLVSIAVVARESIAAMSDIVWAIDPRRESLLDLTRRMRQHASELFSHRDITLRFDAAAGAETQRLGIDVRRDLLLIFKEATNNAARHSACTQVDINIRVDRGRLVLSVTDDGVGFDPAGELEGQGLASMRRRAARVGAELRIERASPSGTAVILSLPLRS